VHFQKNAWADGNFCRADILEVAGDMYAAGSDGEVVIGMDNYSAQRTSTMESLYNGLGMVPLYTPPGCTDCCSPVDHHIGRFIQERMSKMYDAEILAHPEIWIAHDASEVLDDPGCKSAMQRRMLMASWLSAAWKDLTDKFSHMIRSAFVHTGFLLALDGSEDGLIDLQGYQSSEPYAFRTMVELIQQLEARWERVEGEA
jgi:DNA-directed RNA polymerase subunit N (RpoN/RPB10)